MSAQTVYDSIGSKQALVARLNDLIDTEAGIADISRGTRPSRPIPCEVAATSARVITRSILDHCGDVIHALVTGAAAEPDLAVVMAEGQRRHDDGRGAGSWGGCRSWMPSPPSVDVDGRRRHARPRSPMSGSPSCCSESYGWSLDQVEAWIAATSRDLLLRPA